MYGHLFYDTRNLVSSHDFTLDESQRILLVESPVCATARNLRDLCNRRITDGSFIWRPNFWFKSQFELEFKNENILVVYNNLLQIL